MKGDGEMGKTNNAYMMEKEKYPIPDFCKADCRFRDKEAKYMPACQYPFQLDIDNDKCNTYKPGERGKSRHDKN